MKKKLPGKNLKTINTDILVVGGGLQALLQPFRLPLPDVQPHW